MILSIYINCLYYCCCKMEVGMQSTQQMCFRALEQEGKGNINELIGLPLIALIRTHISPANTGTWKRRTLSFHRPGGISRFVEKGCGTACKTHIPAQHTLYIQLEMLTCMRDAFMQLYAKGNFITAAGLLITAIGLPSCDYESGLSFVT